MRSSTLAAVAAASLVLLLLGSSRPAAACDWLPKRWRLLADVRDRTAAPWAVGSPLHEAPAGDVWWILRRGAVGLTLEPLSSSVGATAEIVLRTENYFAVRVPELFPGTSFLARLVDPEEEVQGIAVKIADRPASPSIDLPTFQVISLSSDTYTEPQGCSGIVDVLEIDEAHAQIEVTGDFENERFGVQLWNLPADVPLEVESSEPVLDVAQTAVFQAEGSRFSLMTSVAGDRVLHLRTIDRATGEEGEITTVEMPPNGEPRVVGRTVGGLGCSEAGLPNTFSLLVLGGAFAWNRRRENRRVRSRWFSAP